MKGNKQRGQFLGPRSSDGQLIEKESQAPREGERTWQSMQTVDFASTCRTFNEITSSIEKKFMGKKTSGLTAGNVSAGI